MMPHLLAVAFLLTAGDGPSPRPELGPDDVVWAVVDALRDNDRGGKDSGIAIVFRFASESNQAATGPLARFTEIVKSPGYAPMIGHRVAGMGRLVVVEGHALQRVTIIAASGKAIEYEFLLSKDPKTRAWRSDSVVPVPDAPAPPSGRVI